MPWAWAPRWLPLTPYCLFFLTAHCPLPRTLHTSDCSMPPTSGTAPRLGLLTTPYQATGPSPRLLIDAPSPQTLQCYSPQTLPLTLDCSLPLTSDTSPYLKLLLNAPQCRSFQAPLTSGYSSPTTSGSSDCASNCSSPQAPHRCPLPLMLPLTSSSSMPLTSEPSPHLRLLIARLPLPQATNYLASVGPPLTGTTFCPIRRGRPVGLVPLCERQVRST
eukprot:1138055-Pelagomonas_calceolata.AAC.2